VENWYSEEVCIDWGFMGETLSAIKIRFRLIKVTFDGEIRMNQVIKLYRKFAALFQALRRRVTTQRKWGD
jgi:hypothetical protein